MDKKTLKQWRLDKGITQKHVAKELGVTTQTIRNKESGNTKFSVLETDKLCSIYGITIEQVNVT